MSATRARGPLAALAAPQPVRWDAPIRQRDPQPLGLGHVNNCIRSICLTMVALLGACANVPLGQRFAEVDAAPADRALVYIYRPYTKASSAYGVLVSVDGMEKVALPPEAYTRFTLQPGEHEFAFNWPAIALQRGIKGSAQFEKGRTYFIRYVAVATFGPVQSAWIYSAQHMDASRAIEELKCCSFSQPRD